MLAEVKTRIGEELETLSHELTLRMSARLSQSLEVSESELAESVERIYQKRIRFLGQLLAGMTHIDPRTLWTDRVGYGSLVRIRDLDTGVEETVTLLTGHLVDPEEGQLSMSSPLGEALLGRSSGEIVTVPAPGGERRYQIVDFVPLTQRVGQRTAEMELLAGEEDAELSAGSRT